MNLETVVKASLTIEKLRQTIASLNNVGKTEKFNRILYGGYKVIPSVDAKNKPITTQVSNSFELDEVDSDACREFLIGYYSDKIEALATKLEEFGVDSHSISQYVDGNLEE